MTTIQPRTLKGFRDFLPADMRIRQKVFQVFRTVFESYGYEPLETPTLEYADILMGKYGEEAEKLIYNFEDRGGRQVAMRYDVTVPACRVLAQYKDKLPLPFKRYQIQPVWRADNTQKGRFREFYQCDADTFGTSSVFAEAEFIGMGIQALQKLGFDGIDVRINNRKIIDAMVTYAGAGSDMFYTVCTAIDKMDKIGIEGVEKEMKEKGVPDSAIEKLKRLLMLESSSALSQLKDILQENTLAQEGIKEITDMIAYLDAAGFSKDLYRFDISIIRGLSYYTGPVWEFTILDGGVGSVGGGGRYDTLVATYSGENVPAAGGSFGIERLIEIITDRKMLQEGNEFPVLVAVEGMDVLPKAIQFAQKLRSEAKQVVIYPDATKDISKQLKYADKRGLKLVYIVNTNGEIKLKNMKTGTTENVH